MKKIDYRKLCHPAHPEFRLATSPFYLMAHADFDYHEDMSTVLEKHDVNRSMYRMMTDQAEYGEPRHRAHGRQRSGQVISESGRQPRD
jgi:hypothetical protein